MREQAMYETRIIPTVTLVTDTELAELGAPIRAVYVRKLTTTTEVQIKVGRNGGLVTLRQGEGIEAPGPSMTAGIFISAAAGGAGAGAEITMVRDDRENDVVGPTFRVVSRP